MEFEDVYNYIGEIGLYQVLLFVLAGLAEMMGPEAIGMNFVGYNMEHWCRVPALGQFSHNQQKYIAIPTVTEQGRTRYDRCKMFPFNFSSFSQDELLRWNRSAATANLSTSSYLDCNGWVYDKSVMVSTITNKWNLVCDKSWLIQLVSSVYMFGRLLSSIISGITADRIGRKPAILIFLVIKITGSCMSIWGQYYPVFIIGRFFMAIGTTGSKLSCYVLAMEIMGKNSRSYLGTMWQLNWTVGYMIFAIIGYVIRDYVRYQIATLLPVAVLFLYIIVLEESPRWLISKSKLEKGMNVLNKVAKINGRSIPQDMKIKIKGKSDTKEATLIDVWKIPNLRKKSFVLYLLWMTNNLVYYGLSLNAGALSGNVFLNTFISGAVEVPAVFAATLMVNRVGRKASQMTALVIASISSWICVPLILRGLGQATTAMAMVGKAGITMSISTVYLWSVELFPTEARNAGLGSASMLARVAGIAAPFVGGPLGNVWAPLPLIIFGTFGTLSVLAVILLPETINQNLPDTIEEAEKFGRKKSKYEDKSQAEEYTETTSM